MPAASGLFLLVGVSLAAGALGHRLLQRRGVCDVVPLLAVGVLLGPVLHLVDAEALRPALPFLAPLGLSLVLFEGGLQLPVADLRRHAARGLAMTLVTWTATLGAVAAVAHLLVGLPWTVSILLGMAVAATGVLVVVPLLAHLRAPPDAKVALTLETAVGDLLSAVGVTALASAIALGTSPRQGVFALTAELGFGALAGVVAAILWWRLRRAMGPTPHDFALTLASLVATYAGAEAIGGSGYLAALVFGLLLGNAHAVAGRLGLAELATPSEGARLHQGEAVFILRSLFFVYLGVAMTPALLGWANLGVLAALTAAMIAARLVGVLLTARGRTAQQRETRLLLVGMMPRGLAAVIAATIPASLGVVGAEGLLELAFLVLVGCDLATSAMLLAYQRRRASATRAVGAVAVGQVAR